MSDEAATTLSGRQEDYLEAVLVLVQRTGAARVRDIAGRTGVSKSTVTAALRKLSESGLVHYDPYQLVTLTEQGQAQAARIRGKHEALAEFLEGVLGLDRQRARDNACRMEHVVDDEVLERLSLLAEFAQAGDGDAEGFARRFADFCRRREAPAGSLDEPDHD